MEKKIKVNKKAKKCMKKQYQFKAKKNFKRKKI